MLQYVHQIESDAALYKSRDLEMSEPFCNTYCKCQGGCMDIVSTTQNISSSAKKHLLPAVGSNFLLQNVLVHS